MVVVEDQAELIALRDIRISRHLATRHCSHGASAAQPLIPTSSAKKQHHHRQKASCSPTPLSICLFQDQRTTPGGSATTLSPRSISGNTGGQSESTWQEHWYVLPIPSSFNILLFLMKYDGIVRPSKLDLPRRRHPLRARPPALRRAPMGASRARHLPRLGPRPVLPPRHARRQPHRQGPYSRRRGVR